MSDKPVQMCGVYNAENHIIAIDSCEPATGRLFHIGLTLVMWSDLKAEGYTCRPIWVSEQEPIDAALLREIEQWFEFYLAWSTEITTQGRGMVKGILTRLREALNDEKGGRE